jgi:hypothetical protein
MARALLTVVFVVAMGMLAAAVHAAGSDPHPPAKPATKAVAPPPAKPAAAATAQHDDGHGKPAAPAKPVEAAKPSTTGAESKPAAGSKSADQAPRAPASKAADHSSQTAASKPAIAKEPADDKHAAASKPANAKEPAAAAATAPSPTRATTSEDLRALNDRIQQRLAEVISRQKPAGARAAAQPATAARTAAPSAPPAPRVRLVWRASVDWPQELQEATASALPQEPQKAETSAPRVDVTWSGPEQ